MVLEQRVWRENSDNLLEGTLIKAMVVVVAMGDGGGWLVMKKQHVPCSLQSVR